MLLGPPRPGGVRFSSPSFCVSALRPPGTTIRVPVHDPLVQAPGSLAWGGVAGAGRAPSPPGVHGEGRSKVGRVHSVLVPFCAPVSPLPCVPGLSPAPFEADGSISLDGPSRAPHGHWGHFCGTRSSPGCPSYAARACPYHRLSYTQTNMAPNRSLQKWLWENGMVGGEPVGRHPARL